MLVRPSPSSRFHSELIAWVPALAGGRGRAGPLVATAVVRDVRHLPRFALHAQRLGPLLALWVTRSRASSVLSQARLGLPLLGATAAAAGVVHVTLALTRDEITNRLFGGEALRDHAADVG